jgi:hypothetical protein
MSGFCTWLSLPRLQFSCFEISKDTVVQSGRHWSFRNRPVQFELVDPAKPGAPALTRPAALIDGFSHFVTSTTAPVASGWSGCWVGLAPTGKRRLCTAHTPSGLSSAVAPQQLSPPNLLPFRMTVARLPLGSEFSGVAAYGADFVLPTNFVLAYNRTC